ncbi:DUF3243 domain-containing protein [Sporolactobacillus vineae]|uniref:DUF3243 domain-containing protein n=1 Tax=Sporolactobacillus vineae TaxID=444463 RepID=UPI000289FFEC|nr:DUF3243 domain-containing protein [Sporolactobacillus vineae]
MSVMSNWDQWKDFLADQMHRAENIGASSEIINDFATKIGGYLSDHVDPKNEQQRMLADLWHVADTEEQKTIARLIMKLVNNNGTLQQPELQR